MEYGQKIVDFDKFMSETGLDVDTVKELYAGFIKEMDEESKKLLFELSSGNYSKLAKTVHNIKGISGSYMLVYVFEKAREIDASIKENSLEGVESAVIILENHIEEALAEIRQYLRV